MSLKVSSTFKVFVQNYVKERVHSEKGRLAVREKVRERNRTRKKRGKRKTKCRMRETERKEKERE